MIRIRLTTVIVTAFMFGLLCGCAATGTLPTAQPLNPGDPFPADHTDSLTGMEFVLISAGSFSMGSPANEAGRDPDEGPLHTVFVGSFYLGKYEVTQAQWQAVMSANPSNFQGSDQLPVEGVSWNAAHAFVSKLNNKTGNNYRLPTEAEWEYACRAGTQTPFVAGSTPEALNEYGWFTMNSGKESHPVGSRLPNTWGVYDMHGNISEWVSDGRRGYLSRIEHNPEGPDGSAKALHRGGSWIYPARLCRSANRMDYEKNTGSHLIGLRLALDKKALAP
ncbi:MAG: formylglycine-generating enzyme family protein [Deltaproteobacteria bacterium]|nr:formylglycine-generating enzyme family protein [Deltaproteobacteria bacterium]